MTIETVSGPLFTEFGNAISDVIHEFLKRGLNYDEVASITVQVAADYFRSEYPDRSMEPLARILVDRGVHPLPKDISLN